MQSIQKRIDTLLESNRPIEDKLQKICQLLFDEFEHYNWVGFYFKNGDKQELKLGPYVGEATEHNVIPYGKGICGQVAVSNETMLVNDVEKESNYLACSLATKAEIVVPIFKNDENIGQIDIDSHFKDSLSKSDQIFLEDLMLQVAKFL